jgi:hypothetical protein
MKDIVAAKRRLHRGAKSASSACMRAPAAAPLHYMNPAPLYVAQQPHYLLPCRRPASHLGHHDRRTGQAAHSPATQGTSVSMSLSPRLHTPATPRANRTCTQGLHGDEIDFENTWATIEAAFREIHTKNASKLSYEELYRHAYRIVLKKKGEDLYRNVHNFERQWLASEVRSTIHQLLTPNLLANAQSLGGTTANERRVAGERFLKGLKQAWGDHQVCMSMLADVLMYMVSLADLH